MNIFAVSPDPADCATALDDRRLVKMVLETAQILSTTAHHNGLSAPYKPTHVNHPVVVWCRDEKVNWYWTSRLFVQLCQEYTHRFHREHACWTALLGSGALLVWNPAGSELPVRWVNCTIGYKEVEDVHRAYRHYLVEKWSRDKHPPRWTNRGAPSWYEYRR